MYPRTFSAHAWEDYLQRRLTRTERELFTDFKYENYMNQSLHDLQDNAKHVNLQLPVLTNFHGNCLFESLEYHKLFSNHDDFRKSLAYMLHMFRNQPNFFKGQTDTLNQLYDNFNEIEIVYSRDDQKFNKYTYDCMCQDIVNECTWTRLPTELILMFISKMFNVKFNIYNNQNTWVNTIDFVDPEFEQTMRIIYLGHLDESHYVPLDVIGGVTNTKDKDDITYKYYKDAHSEIRRWAKHQINNQKVEKTK